jgi:hypothetical protein
VRTVRAINQSRRVTLARKVGVAATLWQRVTGLLGRSLLPPDTGLWLTPCHSVHTFFMRFPIDVLFLDRQGAVIYRQTLQPWRLSPWMRSCAGVLELPAGTLDRTKTALGDRIHLEPVN